jgi:tetratricopeptide (TPR) repeat protein
MSGTDTDTSRDSSQLHSGHSGNEEREEKVPADGQNDEELSPDEEYAEIANLSRQGYQLLKKGNVSDAIECFREIIEVDPENNYALVGIGDAYRKKRRYQEATHYYQRCLQFYPENNYALFGLADCYRNMKQFHRAIEVWEKYLVLDDRNVTVLTRVADAYRKVKNLERSEAIYLSVLEMEKDNPYALIGLGHLHYDFKNFEKALGYWMRMYDIQGERVDIRVLTSIGNCYRKLKRFEDGVQYFTKALEREGQNFYALFGLADCYRGMSRPELSIEYWNRILQKDPHNKVILTRAGDAYRRQELLDEAVGCYRRALNIEYDSYAVLGLASINKIRKRYDEAAQSLEGLLKNEGRIFRVYPELMECYVNLRDRHAARNLWEKFERLRGIQPPVQRQMKELKQKIGV